jgi:phosphatidate phosphatase PAH1
MEPEEFVRALTKEVLKKTGNIKANMMSVIRGLFTTNPFIGGLGNRENDAVAYLHGGITLEKIFIIDSKSKVQQMSSVQTQTTYL